MTLRFECHINDISDFGDTSTLLNTEVVEQIIKDRIA